MICKFFITLFGGFLKSIITYEVIKGLQSCSKPSAPSRWQDIPVYPIQAHAGCSPGCLVCIYAFDVSPWFNVVYFQFEQVRLRLWSIPVCCFNETFMKSDFTLEYSGSQTFVPGWGEAFGSRWCLGSFSGGRMLCAGGWSQTCQGHLGCARLQRMVVRWKRSWCSRCCWDFQRAEGHTRLELWQDCVHAQRWAGSAS